MKQKNVKIGSNRSFGIVFFIVFFIVSIYPEFNFEELKVWSLIAAIIFLILGLLNSSILAPLNKLWFEFGIFLGNIVSPVVMAIIFFGIVTPTSIIMKLLGKNLLGLKRISKRTYWVKRSEIKSKMKNQF